MITDDIMDAMAVYHANHVAFVTRHKHGFRVICGVTIPTSSSFIIFTIVTTGDGRVLRTAKQVAPISDIKD